MIYDCDCPFCRARAREQRSEFYVQRNPRKYEEVAGFSESVEKLLAMGFKKSELAQILCDSLQNHGIECSTTYATHWFIPGGRNRGTRRPSPLIQKAIVKMAEELRLPLWKAAVENLVSVGYSIDKIAYLISQRVEIRQTSIVRYLYDYRRPPLKVQQVIVDIADEFVNIDPSTIIVPKKLPKRTKPLSPDELESIIIESQLRARAVRLRDQGMHKKDICAALSIGQPRLNALLVGTESPGERKKREALSLLDDKELTFDAAADRAGVARQSLSTWAAEALHPRALLRTRATKEEKEDAIRLCQDTKMPYNAIGRRFNRSGSTIRDWCIEAGAEGGRAKPPPKIREEKRKRKAKPRTPLGAKEKAFEAFFTTNLPNTCIAAKVGVSDRTVGIWRKEFNDKYCDVCGKEVLGRFKRHPACRKRRRKTGS
jgi:transposase-like protein